MYKKFTASWRASVGLVFGAFLFLLTVQQAAAAQAINLAWDPNPETDIAGYKLYYKAEGSSNYNGTGATEGNSPLDIGSVTFASVSGLDETKVTCFAVTAYNTAGQESGHSSEICTTAVAPPQPDCTDNDGDGFFVEGGECGPLDCNDADANIHPNAAEVPNNGVDENCNGMADDSQVVSPPLLPIPQVNWKPVYVDSEELVGENGAARNAFDGDPQTFWHTRWYNANDPIPHEIQIDLGSVYAINGLRYLPRQDGSINGTVGQYEIYLSNDGSTWNAPIAAGTFASDTQEKEVLFAERNARFLRFRALSEVNGNPWISMAELNLLGTTASVPPSGPICTDADGDGFALEGGSCGPVDCDDSNPNVFPEAQEIPYNGIDESCNGMVDDDDLDGDGYVLANDCDDKNSQINPGVAEIPYNGVDENCNGMTDDDDLDNDGFAVALDCDDTSFAVNPDAAEVCTDGIDNNCDGLTDAEDGVCAPVCTDADGDGFAVEGGSCGEVDPDDGNALIYPGAPPVLAEPEMATSTIDHNWQAVTLSGEFSAPVVIAGPPGVEEADAGLVRINKVAASSFEVRFQEWGANVDDLHLPENLAYLVLEQGRHQMADGSIWEVGTFEIAGTGTPVAQNFTKAFAGVPALFLTLQTANDAQAATVRAAEVQASGFMASLFEEEARMDGHQAETVGYLAIYSPGNQGDVEINGQTLSYQLQRRQIGNAFAKVMNMALKLEEEQSLDAEQDHVAEDLDLLLLDGKLFAQDVSCREMDSVALRCDDKDSDGDGYVDSIDAFPTDSTRWEAEAAPPADSLAPVVSVIDPGYGAAVSGTIPVEIAASDDTAVNRVELYINGSLYGTDTVAPYSFNLDTTGYGGNSLEISARAYDPAGNEGVSDVLVVYPSNDTGTGQAPVVTILSPGADDRIGRRVIVEAVASDDVKVEMMEFYLDGTLEKVRYAEYLRTVLFTRRMSRGDHTLTIKAYDADGNVGEASVIFQN